MTKITYQPTQGPKRGPDGLYHFICDPCLIEYTAKSPFSTSHSQSCRNEKNRRRRNAKYAAEIEYTNKFKHNAMVLRQLYEDGVIAPVMQVMELMKFHFDILPEIEKQGNEEARFFCSFGIIRVSEDKFKIVRKNDNQ